MNILVRIWANSSLCPAPCPGIILVHGKGLITVESLMPRRECLFTEKHVIIGIHKRHGKILLYERYRAPNWKSVHSSAWMKLFAAIRSKRKFNNPVSFDEKRHMRG